MKPSRLFGEMELQLRGTVTLPFKGRVNLPHDCATISPTSAVASAGDAKRKHKP
jgi:hypothetical protein